MKPLFKTKTINAMIAITAATIIVMFLLFYSETGSPPKFSSTPSENINPNFYLINAKNSQFDQQGVLDMIIKSDSVYHNPADNSSQLKQPRITLYKNGVLDWTMQSDLGVAYQSKEQIDLIQQVIIANRDNQMVLKTQYLSLYPKQKRAETDKPVTLQSAAALTHAIGLNANMLTKEVQLLEQVRGHYHVSP